MHVAGLPTAIDLVADLRPGVRDGVRVGHGGHIREATVDGGAAARLDGLLVLEARVAKVDVHVDETGHEVPAVGIDLLALPWRIEIGPHRGDVRLVDEDVDHLVEADLRVNRMYPPKQKCHDSLLPEAGTSRPYA